MTLGQRRRDAFATVSALHQCGIKDWTLISQLVGITVDAVHICLIVQDIDPLGRRMWLDGRVSNNFVFQLSGIP